MTKPPDTDRARHLLGKRGAFEGVARWPWMASEMGTDEAHTPTTNRSHHSAQRVVETVGRSITNSETPHSRARVVFPFYQSMAGGLAQPGRRAFVRWQWLYELCAGGWKGVSVR